MSETVPLGPTAPYILLPFLRDVSLVGDGDDQDVWITCVEVWEENVYIGTSAGEILQMVRIPADPSDPTPEPIYIPATRLRPDVVESRKSSSGSPTGPADQSPGVQKILLLPEARMTAVISNSSLNFYTLPELSPAFAKFKTFTCTWVEQIDRAVVAREPRLWSPPGTGTAAASPRPDSALIAMSLKQKIRRVLLEADQPRRMGDIEFGGSIAMLCRGRVACVADCDEYALVDLVGSQKIGLFSISPERQQRESVRLRRAEERARELEVRRKRRAERRAATVSSRSGPPATSPAGRAFGHLRSVSLGVGLSPGRLKFDVPEALRRSMAPPDLARTTARLSSSAESSTSLLSPAQEGLGGRESPRVSSPASISRLPTDEAPDSDPPDKSGEPGSRDESEDQVVQPDDEEEVENDDDLDPTDDDDRVLEPMKPLIVSPTPTEFLLTTGSSRLEKAMGMFVNMDGDATRGTLEFAGYPERLVVEPIMGQVDDDDDEQEPTGGFVLAVVRAPFESGDDADPGYFLEIQRWDVDPGEESKDRQLYNLSSVGVAPSARVGLQQVRQGEAVLMGEISSLLTKVPFEPTAGPDADVGLEEAEAGRVSQEKELAEQLARVRTVTVCWADRDIFWTMQNHALIRLNSRLDSIEPGVLAGSGDSQVHSQLSAILAEIPDGGRSALDVYAGAFLGQKTAVMLFVELARRTGGAVAKAEISRARKALVTHAVDVRAVLALVPRLRSQIVCTAGVWVFAGVRRFLRAVMATESDDEPETQDGDQPKLQPQLLELIRQLLQSWRQKRGFGSVEDGPAVFATIDGCLARILIGIKTDSALAELGLLVQDREFVSSESTVAELESAGLLEYVAALHASRGDSAAELLTWRRLVDQADAAGDSARAAEAIGRVWKALGEEKDDEVVAEHAVWLAGRDPAAGVAVLTAEVPGRGLRFPPEQAVAMIQAGAPAAERDILEALVFSRKLPDFSGRLASKYVDALLAVLAHDTTGVTDLIADSNAAYRALARPKPTFRRFVAENGRRAEWAVIRSRLLRLLAGPTNLTLPEIDDITARLDGHGDGLLAEMALLRAAAGQDGPALRLMAVRLADLDGAIEYCLAGGGSGWRSRSRTAGRDRQEELFRQLLMELLAGEGPEPVAELLRRFGQWFRLEDVLVDIPDEWPVELFGVFVVSAIRRLVRERAESTVGRELWESERTRAMADLVDTREKYREEK